MVPNPQLFCSVEMLTSFVLQLQANVEAFASTFLGPANAGNLQDATAGKGAGTNDEREAPDGGEGGRKAPRADGDEDVNVEG